MVSDPPVAIGVTHGLDEEELQHCMEGGALRSGWQEAGEDKGRGGGGGEEGGGGGEVRGIGGDAGGAAAGKVSTRGPRGAPTSPPHAKCQALSARY